MAPVSACRRLLLSVLVWLLFVWFLNCEALMVYDRQSLLDIRSTFYKLDVECVFKKPFGGVTTDFAECLHCWPISKTRRKRRRKRGSRGGRTIKLKARLHAGCIPSSFCEPSYGDSVVWRLLDQAHRWLRPVLPLISSSAPCVGFPRTGHRFRRAGAAPGVLRPLRRVSLSSEAVPPPNMALMNARSVVNKTFLLNDFFLIAQFGFYVHHRIMD